MKSIYDMKTIQIDVTNSCNHRCSNCTRLIGHHIKPFFMDLKTIEKALDSLDGYKGCIGLMGGEPTLHPQFMEICKLYQEKIPDRRRRELWTSGYKWKEYEDIINETFDSDCIAYNDHTHDTGKHQSLMIAADEIIDDKEFMWKLIDKCWIQNRWSASITPKGCFFCEVAGAMSYAYDGPEGYPIESGWWNKTPEQFREQILQYCPRCSAAIPLEIGSDHEQYDYITKGNLDRLRELGSPKILAGHYKVYNKPYTYDDYLQNVKTWAPGLYKDFIQHEPNKRLSR
jgi:hypothetical protein